MYPLEKGLYKSLVIFSFFSLTGSSLYRKGRFNEGNCGYGGNSGYGGGRGGEGNNCFKYGEYGHFSRACTLIERKLQMKW